MQEIKKRRIVLASVLKPVNDPRMFEKMGQSLSHHYEVHIIGTRSKTDSIHDNIIFHPLASYSRLSLDRMLAPLRILRKILYLKPAMLVICTHELLWMVLIAKIFLRCPVVYDIRENYFRNILYTNSFPSILRVFIALYVRTKEWITRPLINIFFLAEAGYARELSFVKKKLILENKVKKSFLTDGKKWSADDGNIHMLFSGTLALTTGIFVAIDLCTKLHKLEPRIRLHIIGFSPMQSVYHEIKRHIKDSGFILFEVNHEPVLTLGNLTGHTKRRFWRYRIPTQPIDRKYNPHETFRIHGLSIADYLNRPCPLGSVLSPLLGGDSISAG